MYEYVRSRRGVVAALVLSVACALVAFHRSRGVDALKTDRSQTSLEKPKLDQAARNQAVPYPSAERNPCAPPPPPPVEGPIVIFLSRTGLSSSQFEEYWAAIPRWAKPCLPPSADDSDDHGGCGLGPVTCWQWPCPFLANVPEGIDAPKRGEAVDFSAERFVKGCGARLPTGTLSGLVALLFGEDGRWMPDATPVEPQGSKIDETARKLDRYASVAFPAWWRAHRDIPCPDAIDQLNHYIGARDSLDAWGHPIKLVLCGSSMPNGQGGKWGMRGFMLVSAGKDGRFDTSDDLAVAREPE